MKSTINIISIFFSLLVVIIFSLGCAQPGSGNLVGGEKDVDPPVVLESTPENFSTNFTGQYFEFVFDEYFALKELNQKLIISPPMEEKPEIKVKGKKLQIQFTTELLPDRTYTLNFGDALVDLNESNPLDNFMVVFSTGDKIDSLELQGTVVDAFTNEPVEGVSVMLYAVNTPNDTINTPLSNEAKENSLAPDSREPVPGLTREDTGGYTPTDSLPLTSIPLYLSRTNKEGKYHLKNLAGGEYKLFALLDGNNNYLFDQQTEKVAFVDSLVRGKPPKAVPVTEERDSLKTEDERLKTQEGDSLKTEDLRRPDESGSPLRSDKTQEGDSLKTEERDSTGVEVADSTSMQEAARSSMSGPILRLFTESPPRQFVTGTERKQADKIQIIFNEPLDSVNLDLLYADDIDGGYLYEWSKTKDSLVCWFTDTILSNRDSLVFATGYMAYDSLEQEEWKVDTLRFKFRHSAAREDEINPMTVRANMSRNLELNRPLKLTTGLPFKSIDTSKIALYRVRDSLEFKEDFKFQIAEPEGSIPGIVKTLAADRKIIVLSTFLQDSSYSLRVFPGAFMGYFEHTNDSLSLDLKVNNLEKYGTIILKIENLNEPAILQLSDNKDKLIEERNISSASEEKFALLKPGSYKFKLVLDKNQNGKWDTGRYLKKIQPEIIRVYNKEIQLKANWEMEEEWILKLE